MKKRIAIFPGSFDPITIGHEDILKRVLPLFDEVIVAIGKNSSKQNYFPLEQRKAWVEKVFKNQPKVKVETYTGLTVAYCKKKKADFIVRGLRTSADFEFEKAIAHMNAAISGGIETAFILSELKYAALSSSIVRDILRNGGDVGQFLPAEIKF